MRPTVSDNPENRRLAPRRMYKTQAFCQKGRDGLGEMLACQLLNLSNDGAQVLVRGEFSDGDVFYLALLSPRRQTIADVKSTVRWRAEEAPGVLRIGLSFDRQLTDDELATVH
jgi:hypothetical protein